MSGLNVESRLVRGSRTKSSLVEEYSGLPVRFGGGVPLMKFFLPEKIQVDQIPFGLMLKRCSMI